MNATIKELVEFEKGETTHETRKIKSKRDQLIEIQNHNKLSASKFRLSPSNAVVAP